MNTRTGVLHIACCCGEFNRRRQLLLRVVDLLLLRERPLIDQCVYVDWSSSESMAHCCIIHAGATLYTVRGEAHLPFPLSSSSPILPLSDVVYLVNFPLYFCANFSLISQLVIANNLSDRADLSNIWVSVLCSSFANDVIFIFCCNVVWPVVVLDVTTSSYFMDVIVMFVKLHECVVTLLCYFSYVMLFFSYVMLLYNCVFR